MVFGFQFYKFVALIVIAISISACGGGGGGATSGPPDNKAPIVVKTIPISEQANVATNTLIEITFDKPIDSRSWTVDKVSILQLVKNKVGGIVKPDTYERILFNNNQLKTSTRDTKLRIVLDNTSLNPLAMLSKKKHYRVTIENVRDYSGNILLNSCQWKFSTIGADSSVVNTGNSGLCSSNPALIKPAIPKNFTAKTNSGKKVYLQWETPVTGIPSHYKLDVSTDNQRSFQPLETNLAGISTKYTIPEAMVTVEKNNVYRLIAVNTIGEESPIILSNSVIPLKGLSSTKPLTQLFSPSLLDGSEFGQSVAISPDGNFIAVGEQYATPGSIASAGQVQFYRKSITGSWQPGLNITSANQTFWGGFGFCLAFSPDGKTLAVCGGFGNNVELFYVDIANDWNSVIKNGPVISRIKGGSIAFSNDNSSLIIGNDFGGIKGAGVAEIFSRNGINWYGLSPKYVITLSSRVSNPDNAFGFSVAFSPDSNTIAVGEQFGDPVGSIINSGAVHLFIRNGTTWTSSFLVRGPTLSSQNPNDGDIFSYALAFSPDGLTLAVGTYFGNNVQLFTISNGSWKNIPTRGSVLVSQLPSLANEFGKSLSFKSDNSMLAVGEERGDIVNYPDSGITQIFEISGTDWSLSPTYGMVLGSKLPGRNSSFGNSLMFDPSLNGTTLIIGEVNGASTDGTSYPGIVNIFKPMKLIP